MEYVRFVPKPSSDHCVDLTLYADREAIWALAEFVKRTQFEHFLTCAVDREEACMMRDGMQALEYALTQKGYAPR